MNTKHKTLTRQVSCPGQPSPSTGRGFSTPCERLPSIVERLDSSFWGLRKQKLEPGYSPAPHQGCLRSFSGCFLRAWATRSWSPPSSATRSQSRIKNITGKIREGKNSGPISNRFESTLRKTTSKVFLAIVFFSLLANPSWLVLRSRHTLLMHTDVFPFSFKWTSRALKIKLKLSVLHFLMKSNYEH